MQKSVLALPGLLIAGLLAATPAAADPAPQPGPISAACMDAFCTPGITGNVVLGAPCGDTMHYVFGTTSWGRLVFCGSPRRYDPRYFRAMPMVGIKETGTNCSQYPDNMAQAPDGLFLTCAIQDGEARWLPGSA